MLFSNKIALTLLCLTILSTTLIVYAQAPLPTFKKFDVPVTNTLNGVYIISNKTTPANANLSNLDTWITGNTGLLLHWYGSNWTVVNSSTTDNLHGIRMINSTSGWAVGGSLTTGTIIYYNGVNWTKWTKITGSSDAVSSNGTINAPLNSITMNSDGSQGWIVGGKGIIFNWDGTQWSGTTQGNKTLRSVSMTAETNDAVIVGDNGTILSWTGNSWSTVPPTTDNTLRSVVLGNSTSGWAVGGDGNASVIVNLSNSGWANWTRITFGGNSTNDKVNVTLNSVSMATPNSGWIVGGEGRVLYWDGNIWNLQTGITSNGLNGVAMAQNITVLAWAVGGSGTILASQGIPAIPEFPVSTIPILIGILIFTVLLNRFKSTRVPVIES